MTPLTQHTGILVQYFTVEFTAYISELSLLWVCMSLVDFSSTTIPREQLLHSFTAFRGRKSLLCPPLVY